MPRKIHPKYSGFSPLLAATIKPENESKTLIFPLLASAKIDGIRCLVLEDEDGKPFAVSRKLKPIPNKFIASQIEKYCDVGFDGEISLKGGAGENFQQVSSAVMSEDGEPEFVYSVFDLFNVHNLYKDRLTKLSISISCIHVEHIKKSSFIRALPQYIINSREELDKVEEQLVNQGYEGVILRKLNGDYKRGRSTATERHLMKLVRWERFECLITGFLEQLHNENEAKINALGLTERSTHKDNKVGKNTLGSFVVKLPDGTETKISTGVGLTNALRKEVWDNQHKYLGKWLTAKRRPYGEKDKPRFPLFVGFRDEIDM